MPAESSAEPSTDVTVVADVRRRCVAAGEQDPLDEAASLRLKHHGLDGSALWVTGGDGFALAHAAAVDLAVAPDARGAGRGSALAAAAFAGDGAVTAWSHGDHPAAARLAAAHGLERARELWVMRRPASAPLPEVAVPDGLEVRSYRPEDAAEVVRVNAAAFAHHPEQGAMDQAELAERMAEDWFDPAGLLVAESTGDGATGLLGFHWTKRHSTDLGEVYVVGIDPAAQGRGLGRVLTVAGLAHLAAVGVDEVLLYVESDNTAARRLYEGLGFTHVAADTHVQYRRS
ncbi:mycothiol synthase [Nocardioides sp.]|uniref:mycothiol synthase n=1 Tax=Nocardioides sp. TaxID=35761 RepID=UPI001A2CCAA1|nr:mycothiol synthase [Nocardioides sp.]MBJ7359753.1 mycothiol synthase [Nocardioides sp.]